MAAKAGVSGRGAMKALQTVVMLTGAAAVALLLWEPQIEGRNANATQLEIYFQDPFLAFVYVASISFFTALYQAFKVLGLAGRGAIDSPAATRALRTIKLSAAVMIGFVAVGEIWIMTMVGEDRAGGLAMGGLVALGAVAIGVTAMGVEGAVRRRRRAPD